MKLTQEGSHVNLAPRLATEVSARQLSRKPRS